MSEQEYDETLKRQIEHGRFVLGCSTCEESIRYYQEHGRFRIAPDHNAMYSCQSGGRPHCTCDTCF